MGKFVHYLLARPRRVTNSLTAATFILPVLLRLLRATWLSALFLLIAIALYPVSNRWSRLLSVALLAGVFFGALVLFWKRPVIRWTLLAVITIAAALIFGPNRNLPAVQVMRDDYLKGLQRYDGVTYFWGGENPRGIDCSGLVRRGLIDTLFLRVVRTFHPGLVRESLSLWWGDCTAKALGNGQLTTHVTDSPSINSLKHDQIMPGDLAVTTDGLHVLAYLGDSTWIEADPSILKVIKVQVPARDNGWFQTPVRIVRWRLLQ